MKMRAAVIVEPRKFVVEDREIGCGPDEILVKTEGCGLCTSEIPIWTGQKPQYPNVMGHEGWGVVVEKGKNISGRVQVGDRVSGLGQHSFAEYFTQPEWCTMVLKKELAARCVPGEPYYCVNNVIRAAAPTIGDCLVLIGMGPMGQWALQGLRSPILQAAIAIDVDDDKLKMAREYGATHTVNSKKEDAVARVFEISGGRGADVVVEGTGVKPGMDLAVQCLRRGPRPRLVVMSFFKHPIEVDLGKLCGVSAEIVCAHPGITVDRPDHVRRTEVMINNGVFQADHLVTHRFGLEEMEKAFTMLVDRPAGFNKGIVAP